jgi:uncharacterized membrane protein
MNVEQNRAWGVRGTVIVVGVVAGLLFVLIDLTGSDIDKHASQAGGVALAMVLFTVFGSAGVALANWQPRFALFGALTATLSLLAFGATAALSWESGGGLPGFGYSGTGGTVGGITDMLAFSTAAICVLLATTRPGEDDGTKLVRVTAIGSLALLIALAILQIVDPDVDISGRVYAILATVYVAATAVLLVLRLLPLAEDS